MNEDPLGPPKGCCFGAILMIVLFAACIAIGLLFMGDTLTR